MRAALILFGVLLAALAGCSSVEEKAVSSALEPMARPAELQAGTIFEVTRDGEPLTFKVTMAEGELYRQESSDGCTWTDDGWFMPSTAYANCDGETGTQKVELNGSPWPLQVGNTFSYKASGSNSKGNSWQTVRKCSVTETVGVTVPAGDFDTFKVVCSDDWRTRTYYVSPRVGTPILITNRHRERGTVETYELAEGNKI